MDMIEQGRLEDSKPRRKVRPGKPDKQPDKAKQIKKRREKDFERRGRNIYKFHKRGMK